MTVYSLHNANTTGVISEYTPATIFVADRNEAHAISQNMYTVQSSNGAFTVGNFARFQWIAESEL
jgi:hypothetical protein